MKKTNLLTERKIVLLLLLTSFVLGAQYLFYTPPWQAADEITHYEYIDILSRAKIFQIKQESDYKLQREIIRSMDQFNAWKYVFEERPSPPPKRFWSLPVYEGSGTKLNRPPFYYILGSFVLKIFKTDILLLKHYLTRLFSLFLSLFTILFVFLAAKIVFDDPYYSFTAACLVAFLPQFMIMSGAINSDSMANLIGAASLYVFLLSLKHWKNYYLLLLFPLLIIFGLLTGRKTFFIIPTLIIFGIIYLFKHWKTDKFRTLLFSLVGISALLIAYVILRYILADLGTRVITHTTELFGFCGQVFQKNFWADFKGYSQQFLFRSFWYYSGWMAFRLPNTIYTILAIFSLLGIIGWVKYIGCKLLKRAKNISVNLDFFLLLASICFLAFAGFLCRMVVSMDPMARYVFPALPALAILFVVGLKELIPSKFKKATLTSLISLLVILNIYTIFHHLINTFYFHFW
ncbi:MAG: glycosyltransferase family 39 protein [Candidatus Aminicenantes bacterium]|nr:MAG: glycosyltransferase family 39 protein [Candidatus Aminicenantes bacterium]